MSKGFKIALLTILIIALGYIIPVFLIPGHSENSTSEEEIRRGILERGVVVRGVSVENFLVLKIKIVKNKKSLSGETAYLYTWFGLRYGTVERVYTLCGNDLDVSMTCTPLKYSRFWTKKDFYY